MKKFIISLILLFSLVFPSKVLLLYFRNSLRVNSQKVPIKKSSLYVEADILFPRFPNYSIISVEGCGEYKFVDFFRVSTSLLANLGYDTFDGYFTLGAIFSLQIDKILIENKNKFEIGLEGIAEQNSFSRFIGSFKYKNILDIEIPINSKINFLIMNDFYYDMSKKEMEDVVNMGV